MDLEDWQTKRVDLYTNSSALDFINKYFDTKKGTRCIAGHVKDMYSKRKSPSYRIHNDNKCRAMTLPDANEGNYNNLINYWCVHSFIYTFDKKITEWHDYSQRKSIMENSIVGMNAVIDLDSPEDPDSTKAKRLTFFNYTEKFGKVIKILDEMIDDFGEQYNLMFSGNGIYIMLEGTYDDNLYSYMRNFINLIDTLRQNGLGDSKSVHVDNRSAPWNDYFKIPFTFHEKRNRISIPISKDDFDPKWIDYSSNVDNIYNDYSIINEIIKKADWKRIW